MAFDFLNRDPLLETQLAFPRANGSPLLVNLDKMKEAVFKTDYFKLEINPFRRVVSYVGFKRANGKLGGADGEAPAQPSQDSKAAPRSQQV